MPRTPTRRFALILALTLAATLAACGGPASGPAKMAAPAPPVDDNLADVLPGGAQLVLRVDLEALRRSRLWELAGMLGDLDELARFRESTGIDPLSVVDEVLIAAADRPGTDGFFAAAIKGRFDAPAVVAELVRTGNGTAVQVRGRPAASAEDLLVIALTARTVLAGTPAAMEEALAATFDGGPALAGDGEFAAVVDTEDAVAMRFRQGSTAPDFSKFGARRMPLDGIDQVLALDARLSVIGGLSASAVFHAANRLEASALAKDIRAVKRDLARNPVSLLLGVDWLFEKIVITTDVAGEGASVAVALALDDNDLLQIARLIDRLRKIRELAGDSEPALDSEPAPEDR